MGETDQSKAARGLQSDLQGYTRQLQGLNTGVANRFDNYKDPFNYGNFSAELSRLYNTRLGDINKQTNSNIFRGQQGSAERLASQGITGGSIVNNAANQISNSANKTRQSAISSLTGQDIGARVGAMNMENENVRRNTMLGQNVDFQNIANMLRKYGMVGNSYGMQMSNIGNLDGTNLLDDILAIGNTAAGFIPGN